MLTLVVVIRPKITSDATGYQPSRLYSHVLSHPNCHLSPSRTQTAPRANIMTPFTTSPMVDSLSQTPQSTPRDLSSHAAPSLNAGSPVWWVSGGSQSLVSSLRDVDEKAGSFPGTTLSPSRSQRESGGLHRRRHDSSSPPLRTPSLTPSCLTPSSSMGSSASESGTGAIGLGLFGVPDLPRGYRGVSQAFSWGTVRNRRLILLSY